MTAENARIVGARIRERRRSLGLSQAELANAASFDHHQQVSQIENGDREVKAWELADIARALHTSYSALLPEHESPSGGLVLWRAGADATAEREAAFLHRCEQYFALERLAEDVRRAPLPRVDESPSEMSWSRAAALADDVRDTLDLGSRPAASLMAVLEDRFHVKVLYDELSARGSAASSRGDFGDAVLVNAEEAPWRRNYSCAHEVFHLITWEYVFSRSASFEKEEWHRMEQVAEAFASALLLPADTLLAEYDQLVSETQAQVSDLLSLALGFKVSIDALLWRLVNLNRLDAESVGTLLASRELREKDRQMRSHEWWRPDDLPSRYVRLAYQAHMRDKLSLSKLAEYLDTDIGHVRRRLAMHGLDQFDDESREVLPV